MKKIKSGEDFLDRLYKNLYLEYKKEENIEKLTRISKYLQRLEEITVNASKNGKMDLLKEMYYDKYVIKDISESYYEFQKKIDLEQGYGSDNYTDFKKNEIKNAIIAEQKTSLDIWIDYLSSDDAMYPMWAKYWAFQGMLKIGAYDKEKQEFSNRSKSTVEPFIELDREVLSLTIDYVSKYINGVNLENDEELNKLIANGSFKKIYGYLFKKELSQKQEYETVNGKWIKFNKGSDYTKLVDLLRGKGTGWCTAGEVTAKTHLSSGDFYVYCSIDSNGEYKNPRIAIRMEQTNIVEVRGVLKHQNVEPELVEILNRKLEEFPDKSVYLKKSKDMTLLTKIYEKNNEGEELTKDELAFLYEVNSLIQGFGYRNDPRIEEIINTRNFKDDLSLTLNCKPTEISDNIEDLKNQENIVYYNGDILDHKLKDLSIYKLPAIVKGTVYLAGITDASQLILPTSIKGYLDLSGLRTIEKLIFPKIINSDLNLRNLRESNNIVFPAYVGGNFDLLNLLSCKNTIFPSEIGGCLSLDNLKSAENCVFPKIVGESFHAGSLKNLKNVTFPEKVGLDLQLNNIVPSEGVKLPKTVGGSVYLYALSDANNLILPSVIGWNLYLNGLQSLKGLILPDDFYCGNVIYYKNNRYSTEEFKALVERENCNIDNIERK